MKVKALRSMGDVANALSEARLTWIERVRQAYLDCTESDDMRGFVEVPTEQWEALSAAIRSPCRLRDGIAANDAQRLS